MSALFFLETAFFILFESTTTAVSILRGLPLLFGTELSSTSIFSLRGLPLFLPSVSLSLLSDSLLGLRNSLYLELPFLRIFLVAGSNDFTIISTLCLSNFEYKLLNLLMHLSSSKSVLFRYLIFLNKSNIESTLEPSLSAFFDTTLFTLFLAGLFFFSTGSLCFTTALADLSAFSGKANFIVSYNCLPILPLSTYVLYAPASFISLALSLFSAIIITRELPANLTIFLYLFNTEAFSFVILNFLSTSSDNITTSYLFFCSSSVIAVKFFASL